MKKLNKAEGLESFWENSILFEDICREWLTLKKVKLKKSSFYKYHFLTEQYLIPILGKVAVNEFNCDIFEKALYEIRNNNREIPFSRSTMNTILYLVRAILKYGERHGYNQIPQIEFDCEDISKQSRYPVLDTAEEQILIKYLLENPLNKNHLGILLALMSGMRIGEICALKRKAINKEFRFIHISETAQRVKIDNQTSLIITTPKSKHSIRTLPISEIVYEYMDKNDIWRLDSEQNILSGKECPYEPRTLQYAFQKVLIKCGIVPINFHALRHTFATNCVEIGFDIKTLSEILGHANVNFTLNKYVHSSISMKQRQIQRLNDKYHAYFAE